MQLSTLLAMFGRGAVAGFLVVAVAEIAGRFPRIGALILTLPIVIPVVFLTMYLKNSELAPIARLARETLILIPLGLPFFVPLAVAPRMGIGFWPAFLAGLFMVAGTIAIYLRLAPRGI
jgi:hypothetical protein